MQGLYRITSGGNVSEYRNVITDAGQLGILRAVSGQRQGWASSIVAGIGSTAATSADTALEYLYSGGDINTTIIDPINDKLYFKTSLPLQDEFTIYELGCYSSNTLSTHSSESGGGAILISFTSGIPWIDTDGVHTLDTTNSRIGPDSIAYTIGASADVAGNVSFINDLTNIPLNASFKLAYYVQNIADFSLYFKVDSSNYFKYTGWTLTNGYHIGSKLKSSAVVTGTPSWADVQTIEIYALATGAGGSISLDSLRYELPLSEESHLLSRVVLTTPQVKLPGVSLDIEYVLEI